MQKFRNRKGFTLIELMIVVVIIGILAALAIPRFANSADRAKEKEADGILKQIYTMQEVVFARDGAYTADIPTLTAVGYQAPTTLTNYNAPTITVACAAMTKNPATASHDNKHILYSTGAIGVGACP